MINLIDCVKYKVSIFGAAFALGTALIAGSAGPGFCQGPYTMAPPVSPGSGNAPPTDAPPDASVPDNYDPDNNPPDTGPTDQEQSSQVQPPPSSVSASTVFNWQEVPVNQTVPIDRAVFDQDGYQLYDNVGETIIVKYNDDNLYVMKFAVSHTGDMYFVNSGTTPVLYVPADGYLENATVAGARWYPFTPDFQPATPVFLGCAPSWDDYVDIGWYPGMYCYGGYWCGTSVGYFGPTFGLFISVGGHRFDGWSDYGYYARDHGAPHRIGIYNQSAYHFANRSFAGGRSFRGSGSFSGRSSFGGRAGSAFGGQNSSGRVFRGAAGFGSHSNGSYHGGPGSFGGDRSNSIRSGSSSFGGIRGSNLSGGRTNGGFSGGNGGSYRGNSGFSGGNSGSFHGNGGFSGGNSGSFHGGGGFGGGNSGGSYHGGATGGGGSHGGGRH